MVLDTPGLGRLLNEAHDETEPASGASQLLAGPEEEAVIIRPDHAVPASASRWHCLQLLSPSAMPRRACQPSVDLRPFCNRRPASRWSRRGRGFSS
jgi:hypothetical protein